MSLWICPMHGLTGPMPCCDQSSFAQIQPISPELRDAAEAALTRTAPPDEVWIPKLAAELAKLKD
jgi:hypothetical protein